MAQPKTETGKLRAWDVTIVDVEPPGGRLADRPPEMEYCWILRPEYEVYSVTLDTMAQRAASGEDGASSKRIPSSQQQGNVLNVEIWSSTRNGGVGPWKPVPLDIRPYSPAVRAMWSSFGGRVIDGLAWIALTPTGRRLLTACAGTVPVQIVPAVTRAATGSTGTTSDLSRFSKATIPASATTQFHPLGAENQAGKTVRQIVITFDVVASTSAIAVAGRPPWTLLLSEDNERLRSEKRASHPSSFPATVAEIRKMLRDNRGRGEQYAKPLPFPLVLAHELLHAARGKAGAIESPRQWTPAHLRAYAWDGWFGSNPEEEKRAVRTGKGWKLGEEGVTLDQLFLEHGLTWRCWGNWARN